MPNFTQGYALVLGIANYTGVRPLPETVLKDARDVAALLQQPDRAGYPADHVKLILDRDATKQAILDGLAWLAGAAGGGATALVYYSGHGGRLESGPNAGNYLIPVDTRLDAIRETAIGSDELTAALRAIHADRLVALLDACHSGGAGDAKDIGAAPLDPNAPTLKGGLDARVYDQLAQGAGRAVFASSKTNELSYVLPGASNSLFTQVMLEALNGRARQRGDGLLRLFDIVEYVWEEVPKRYALQHPIFKAQDIDSNFPLALFMGGRKSLDPAAALAPLQTAVDKVQLRDLIVARKNLEDLELLCDDVENEMRRDGIELQFNMEIVGGQGKAVRVKRLIEYLDNRGRLAYLVRAIRKEFPGEI
ncbi:MAG: caspase family protein [Chloroflexi bacterium]|nr:caspase family protein [Chloroflexota bacterium]MCL5274580.1 caspase family protein [Chloroflexota bacterium]